MDATALATSARVVNRAAVVSGAGHVLLLALGVFAAVDLGSDDPGSTTFWLLALFCALGLVATVLAWASVRVGKPAWDAGVVTVLVSVAVMVWMTTVDGGIPTLLICVALLLLDWLVFTNARRALPTP